VPVRAGWALGAVAALLCLTLLLLDRGSGRLETTTKPAGGLSSVPRLFSPSSPWNSPVAASAPLEPGSARMVSHLRSQVAEEQAGAWGPWISTTSYSVPIYTVGPDQPTVRVKLTSPVFSPALQSAFEAVPLPARAYPSGGTDGHLVVWQPSSDRLWEFWRLVRSDSGPEASWGGAMEDVSESSGIYGRDSWADAEPWWGASASSLSIAGGLITLEDLRRGEIDHALAIALPEIRAGVYASPARRSDGKSSDPLSLPEGAHLRLDPNLDLDRLAMPPLTRMIAEAAQRYGFFVRDGARGVQLFAQDPVTAPRNPYTGPEGYFEGQYPNQLLASFPWGRLQVMKMDLHRDS
jgi:hypothetical protein